MTMTHTQLMARAKEIRAGLMRDAGRGPYTEEVYKWKHDEWAEITSTQVLAVAQALSERIVTLENRVAQLEESNDYPRGT